MGNGRERSREEEQRAVKTGGEARSKPRGAARAAPDPLKIRPAAHFVFASACPPSRGCSPSFRLWRTRNRTP